LWSSNLRPKAPGWWVPSAYLAEGIPFAIAGGTIATLFKDLGHSDGEITLALGGIVTVWSLKPIWAAFLDMSRTKRFWVLSTELSMSVWLAGLAMTLRLPSYFHVIVAMLWVLAFASATQDICIDGVYITTLGAKQQAQWAGIQGMCWNVGNIFANAAMVWLAGRLKSAGYGTQTAWTFALASGSVVMALFGAYHFFVLPAGSSPLRPKDAREVVATFVGAWRAFFEKKAIWGMLTFILLYRTGEGFLLQEAPLFMQAPRSAGGIGLTLQEKALIDGSVSTLVLIVAGVLGGWFVSRFTLKRTLLLLAICLNVPHVCYVLLSQVASSGAPVSLRTVLLLVSIEKFGYGFGMVGNMLYIMQQVAPGRYKMTHYAFATALMNLVLFPTKALSGPLADWLGYRAFFAWVMLASIPSIFVAWLAPFSSQVDALDEPVGPSAASAAAS
jgi:PAT family beta-lactamase induction signal transducer AmpG